MRIKRDKTNWNATSIIKRDVRHSHDEPRVSLKSKKDTKRWCRGKVGVEHVWERYAKYYKMFIYTRCINCKKEDYGKRSKNTSIPLRIDVDYRCGCEEYDWDNKGYYHIVEVRIL